MSTTAENPAFPHRVAVLMGGISGEHEVSLKSGGGLVVALEELGAEVLSVLVTREGEWVAGEVYGLLDVLALLRDYDVVIPAFHGVGGEDGTMQGLLETAGIRYVGAGVGASAIAMDKWWAKTVVADAGIRIAPALRVDPTDVPAAIADPDALLARLAERGISLPVFVKPNRGGSSIGGTKVTEAAQLPAALALATEGGDAVLIETEIVGREIDLGLLEHADGTLEVAPALEIDADPNQPFFDYAAKYTSGGTHFTVPAHLSDEVAADLADQARRVFRVLGGRGLARIDFFLDEQGPIFNEINTLPGLTAQSQYPQMWAATGRSYPEVVRVLVERALADN
ncbi:D-alanine--D-alanine ligase family protein [Mycetocola saprophilus]|uniref:D-alanine--D-alanine ligase family protein n=1 Tax=Mycetocola saprophilus TaxID=76636 RepID=UPI003BF1481B